MKSISAFSICWWTVPASGTITTWIISFTRWISYYTSSLWIAPSWITLTTSIPIFFKCFTIFWYIYTLSIWISSFCIAFLAWKTWTISKIYTSTIWICLNTSSILDDIITLIALITCGVCCLNFTIRHSASGKC